MKTKLLATLLLFSLLAGVLAVATTIRPVSAINENVTLSVNPPEVTKNWDDPDSFFDVFVTITNVTNLFGFDIRVSWDSSLITLESAEYNASLDALWGVGGWFVAKNETYGGGGGGGGGYMLVALSMSSVFTKDPGSQTLFPLHFKVIKHCNFVLTTPIHFDVAKLSDKGWQSIVHTTVDGLFHVTARRPDLELELYDPNPSKPFEYCKIFEVNVYATHICANLKDYDFKILYDSALLKFVDVDLWGELGDNLTGGASYELLAPGEIHVADTGGVPATGDKIFLFALTFHVEFNDIDITHIWRTLAHDDLIAHVSFEDAHLSFLEGDIDMIGIDMPVPLNVTIHLIRGDVDCNGKVDVFDLRTVAAYYDLSSPVKYDLTMDGTIDIFDLVVVATNFGYGGP